MQPFNNFKFLLKKQLMKNSFSNPLPPLALCIILDVIGYLSFSIPFIGEFSDVIWAPLSAIIYFKLFGGRMGVIGGAFSFLEEILPFTDIIPTFTISWLLKSKAMAKKTNFNNLSYQQGS
jgi:hypothetical protein